MGSPDRRIRWRCPVHSYRKPCQLYTNILSVSDSVCVECVSYRVDCRLYTLVPCKIHHIHAVCFSQAVRISPALVVTGPVVVGIHAAEVTQSRVGTPANNKHTNTPKHPSVRNPCTCLGHVHVLPGVFYLTRYGRYYCESWARGSSQESRAVREAGGRQ